MEIRVEHRRWSIRPRCDAMPDLGRRLTVVKTEIGFVWQIYWICSLVIAVWQPNESVMERCQVVNKTDLSLKGWRSWTSVNLEIVED